MADVERTRKRPSGDGMGFPGDVGDPNARAMIAQLQASVVALSQRIQSMEKPGLPTETIGNPADRTVDVIVRQLGQAIEEMAINKLLGHENRNRLDSLGWLDIINVGAFEIPARSAVEIVAVTYDGVNVTRPVSDGLNPALVLFTGDVAVAASGGTGVGADPYRINCKARYDGSEPSAGAVLATQADSFKLLADEDEGSGFVCRGIVAGNSSLAYVRPHGTGGTQGGDTTPSVDDLVPVKIVSGDGANYTITVHADGWLNPQTDTGTLYIGSLDNSAMLLAGTELMGRLTSVEAQTYECSIPFWM